jgi:hypothetical protein
VTLIYVTISFFAPARRRAFSSAAHPNRSPTLFLSFAGSCSGRRSTSPFGTSVACLVCGGHESTVPAFLVGVCSCCSISIHGWIWHPCCVKRASKLILELDSSIIMHIVSFHGGTCCCFPRRCHRGIVAAGDDLSPLLLGLMFPWLRSMMMILLCDHPPHKLGP